MSIVIFLFENVNLMETCLWVNTNMGSGLKKSMIESMRQKNHNFFNAFNALGFFVKRPSTLSMSVICVHVHVHVRVLRDVC